MAQSGSWLIFPVCSACSPCSADILPTYCCGECLQEGRWEEEIHLRQELVALARLHCQFEDSPSVDSTALARSHVNLGSTYASIGYWKQAAIHAKRTLDELDKVPSCPPFPFRGASCPWEISDGEYATISDVCRSS